MQPLDTTDRRILLSLSKLTRRTASSLATALGLGRNTVQSRLNRLEVEVLSPIDRRIPPTALGFGLLSFIELHVDQRHLEEIATKLEQIPEVLEAHGLTGSADILVRGQPPTPKSFFACTGCC